MIPDIVIPENRQMDFIIASLIRQEAMLMNVSECVNSILALAEKKTLQAVQDGSDAEFLMKLKELARKLNELYSSGS